MISFAPNLSQRQYTYAVWKTVLNTRGGTPQCDGDNGSYWILWFYDGPEVHMTQVWMATLADDIAASYSGGQVQATTDLVDFTTNVQPTCNSVIDRKAADGRPMQVHTITKFTTNFQLRPFSFQTSTPSSLHNSSPTAVMSDISMKCYDVSGADVTSSPATAVKTVLDFEPAYAYEVIGGWLDIPDGTKTQATTDGPGNWLASAIGVPDVPAIYGGSIPFVYEVDVALIPSGEGRILSDACATSYLKPNATYHTSKIRWIIKHPTGAAQWFQVFVRTFV